MKKEKVIIGGKPLGKFRASFLLFSESLRFMNADREMLFIPVITALMSLTLLVVLGVLVFIVGFNGSTEVFSQYIDDDSSQGSPLEYVVIFCVYVISAFTLAFSQAVISHMVYTRAKGGDTTLGQGLSTALSHSPSLFLWSLITSTVGVVLQFLAERSKLLGRIILWFIGAAWSVLTYFVVPAMVIDKKSAFASIGHSAEVFKRTWGETFISNISIAVVFLAGNLLIIFGAFIFIITAVVLEVYPLVILVLVLLVIMLFLSAILQSTLNGVIKTLLYLYASENFVPVDFNAELLSKVMSKGNVTPNTHNTSSEI
jgi:hypothetical protein